MTLFKFPIDHTCVSSDGQSTILIFNDDFTRWSQNLSGRLPRLVGGGRLDSCLVRPRTSRLVLCSTLVSWTLSLSFEACVPTYRWKQGNKYPWWAQRPTCVWTYGHHSPALKFITRGIRQTSLDHDLSPDLHRLRCMQDMQASTQSYWIKKGAQYLYITG